MKFFLKIKHWQLFILLFGIPMLAYFAVFVSIFLVRDPAYIGFLFQLMMVGMFLFMGIFFGWFYTLGTNLHKMLPDSVNMNIRRFKFFLFVPVVYIAFLMVFMFTAFNNFNEGMELNPGLILLVIPLHLFSMFCIFYCLYFNAKVLKSVQLQRSVTFGDFVGEFFCLWFYPVGIWIVQPTINKLYEAFENGSLQQKEQSGGDIFSNRDLQR